MKVFLLVSMMMASQAFADGLKLGTPSYGGSGCPAGTVATILSPNQDTLSLLFDSYVAEAGGNTGKSFDRKACALAIPVQVPQGYSVAVFKVDYRGANTIPAGAYGRFSAEYFWAGVRGPKIQRYFTGPQNQEFTLTDELLARTIVWAPCGQSVTLRVNSAASVQTNQQYDPVISSLDSADVSTAVIYHLQWRRCN